MNRIVILVAALLVLGPGCAEGPQGASDGADDGADDGPADLAGEHDAADTEEAPPSCLEGETLCEGACVDVRSSHEHCGGCNSPCAPSEVCSAGGCLLECPYGTQDCGGGCVNVDGDRYNCGDCGVICPSGVNADPFCSIGDCAVTCWPGWSDPDGDGNCDSNRVPSGPEVCNGLDDDCNGSVDDTFECSPGEMSGGGPCGMCGTNERACSSSCAWGSWACTGEGVCDPDTTETGAECGNCGRQERTCGSGCAWGTWTCGGEGGCSRGAVEDCGECGQRTCSITCQWGSCGAARACEYFQTCTPGGDCVDQCGDGQCSLGEFCSGCSGDCGACGGGTGFQCCTDWVFDPGDIPDPPALCNNMCHFANIGGLPMTMPGGYCDPDGNGYRDDGDWVRGYEEYCVRCPHSGCP